MTRKVGRREFLKGGAGLAAAGLVMPATARDASANATSQGNASTERYATSWYPFTGHPDADTCWSLSVGPDGRIYAAACAESVPGGVVKVVRYNEEKDALDYTRGRCRGGRGLGTGDGRSLCADAQGHGV